MNTLEIILLIVLGIALLLLLTALIRTFLIKAKPIKGESAISYTKEEEALFAERLSEMIKVPTISLRGNDDLTQFHILQDKMRDMFPLIHEKLERTELDGNLLYRWKGSDSSRDGILLMGHQDVVPADKKDWTHDPFEGVIENGIVYGRGAMDCKCTVMAEFSAVEELLGEGFIPPRDVYLSSSCNEEISGGGAIKVVNYLKDKGIRLAAVMDEGGAIMGGMLPGMEALCAAIGIVEKGYMDVKVVAKGSGGHSSTPPKNTPIARLSAFAAEMERKRPYKKKMPLPVIQTFTAAAPYLSFPLRFLMGNLWLWKPLLTLVLPKVSPFGEAFTATTFVFTMCGGSKTPNVIPDEAYLICNLRPSVLQTADEALAIMKKYADKYNLELEVVYKRDASNTVDINGTEYDYVRKCVNDCFPGTAVAPYYMCGGTDCRNYEVISDNCLRFCPIRLTSKQLSAMHAVNENVNTDALAESVKFYKHYIKNHA